MPNPLHAVIGEIPYRLALAGGWIDQPFVSRLNPEPTGSMVVVQIEPNVRFMERAGMATGTRTVARKLWGDRVPEGKSPAELVRTLYETENKGRRAPSGSQDMIGLLYPGISRLDYAIDHEGGYFPRHIETCRDAGVARWLESVIHVIPVAPRPRGYSPLGDQRVTPDLARALGQTGRECFDAIVSRDARRLGESMSACMDVWAAMMPHIVRHNTLELDLVALLDAYRERYLGAMYSGCGGGYLYVVSESPVPGAFSVSVRT